MKTFTRKHIEEALQSLKRKKHLLDEKEITESTKLFFVGTTTRNFDVEQQKFNTYKELDKITVDNAAFGTSKWEYACAYAKQYATKQHHGVIVAFELTPGKKVFDLRDPNEYVQVGLPPELANVFKKAEAYFALNTNIPNQQQGVKPVEFTAAQAWLKYHSSSKSNDILDQIQKLDESKIPSSSSFIANDQDKMLEACIDNAFSKFFGKANWEKNKEILSTQKFNDINDLINLGVIESNLYTKKVHQARLDKKRLKPDFLAYKKLNSKTKISGNKKLEKEFDEFLTQKGVMITAKKYPIFPSNASKPTTGPIPFEELPAEKWKYRFIGASEFKLFPDTDITAFSPQLQNLYHNYALLYKNAKPGDIADDSTSVDEEENQEDYSYGYDNSSMDIIYGYIKLFQQCKHYLNKLSTNGESQFKAGIKRIRDRMKNEAKKEAVLNESASDSSENTSKHVYIDILQYTFYSMLMDSGDYYGVTCPEIRGYAHVNNFSGTPEGTTKRPYGYVKDISASTMCFDDMTVILCKPIHTLVKDIFGHVIDFIDTEDYQKKIKIRPSKRGRPSAADKKNMEKWKEDHLYSAEEFETVMTNLINKDCKSVADYRWLFDTELKKRISNDEDVSQKQKDDNQQA